MSLPWDNAPPPRVIEAQVKTAHFWLAVSGAVVTIAGIVGFIVTRTQAVEICAVLASLGVTLQGIAYGSGSRWNAPRRPWSRSERIARGLSPDPSPPPKTIQIPVNLKDDTDPNLKPSGT